MPIIIPPTPLERGLRAAVYAGVASAGLWTLLNPPTTLGDALGRGLAVLWSVFMLTAAGALVAAVAGRYRVEFLLLPYPTAALAIADLHIWVTVTQPGGLDSDLFSRAAVIGALVAALATRYASLSRLVRQRPRKPRRPGHRG